MSKRPQDQVPKALLHMEGDTDNWSMRLYGVVGDPWDGFDEDQVATALAGRKPGGTVHLNSPGGVITTGMSIYHQVRAVRPAVVRVEGIAASMGSIIALAGERMEMHRGALLMIHNPWNIAWGDANEMRKTADILDKFKTGLIDIYQQKTGLERDLLAEMMDEETWLTADEALEWGFADAIVDDEADMGAVNLSVLAQTRNMPNQVRAMIRTPGKTSNTPAADAVIPENHGDSTMTANTNTPAAGSTPAQDEAALAKARQEAVAAERARVKGIRDLVAAAKHVQAPFAEQLIEEGLDLTTAKARIDSFDQYLEQNQPAPVPSLRAEITRDERDSLRTGVAKALLNRWNPAGFRIEGDEPARQWANMTLIEVARGLVEASGVSTKGMTRHEVARAAFHTTSDFPAILENVITKSLRSRYELSPRTFTVLARQATLPDYKEVSRAQLGEAPRLRQVLEGGEYTYGTIGDAAEKYRLFKYGKIVAITREVIINDDLDAFTRVPGDMGAAAGQLESEVFWAHFTGNPQMHDSQNLFSAAHANQQTTGTVISIASISEGRAAMRMQTGLGGEHRLNVAPRFLVVPPAIETVAEQFVSTNMLADAAGAINPFAGRLQVISEPFLQDNSSTAWYLWADPNSIDTLEYAYLQGEEGPQIETENGFDVDGLKVKVRHDFGVKAIDWRGLWRNAGAAPGG